jgi:chromosome segregation ATPase
MKPDAEIQSLKEEIEDLKQDGEAYLDSASHNMEVALAFKKENEKLSREVASQKAGIEWFRETLQWYKSYSAKSQKEVRVLQNKNDQLHFDTDKKDTRLAALSEGWIEGWDAACRYNELSEEDAAVGTTFHADYDEMAAENLRLETEVDRLEAALDY